MWFVLQQNCFDLPADGGCEISDNAKDLMRKLICISNNRLGQNGISDFKVNFQSLMYAAQN